ncbi:MAG: thiol-disulfide oxidoreductase DCC family protein [Hyphomicrobium sp.]
MRTQQSAQSAGNNLTDGGGRLVEDRATEQRTDCGERLTVYFDGSCPLCQREIAVAKRLTGEGQVNYRDISGCSIDGSVDPDLTVAAAMARFHVRRADGRLTSGAAAFLEMWTASPKLRFLKPLLQNRMAVSALDAVYALFLKIRPRLSAAVRRYDARRNKAS